MKRTVSFIFLLCAITSACFGAELTNIRHSASADKIRIVMEFSSPFRFLTQEQEKGVNILVTDGHSSQGYTYYQVLDALIGKIVLSNTDAGLKIQIPTNYAVNAVVFALKDPDRLVVDVEREERKAENNSDTAPEEPAGSDEQELTAAPPKQEVYSIPSGWFSKAQPVTKGLSYLFVRQEIENGFVYSHALLADPEEVDVQPVIVVPEIQAKTNTSMIGPVLNFFGGLFGRSEDKEKYVHFTKRTVSYFTKSMGASAGINGTFFGPYGTPLGALVINGQLVSSPMYNRTALIIDNDGTAKIDSVKMEGYLKLKDDETLGFSSINQPINRNEIVVYTPYYQMTDPDGASTNIVVVDDKVVDITHGETKVPGNGFIISANGIAGEALKERFEKGDPVKWFFMTTPSFENMKHVVGGGPRLVHQGSVCITSAEESFRRDVAKGRAARTAVGTAKDGKLIFAVVEKGGGSSGATLEELAALMIKLGAVEAMNLDGGGSSTMVINGKTMNSGAGRRVSNAIVIKSK